MSDRYPLIANSETNRIEELASGDNLNLDNSGIVGASTITAEKFVGDLEGTAQFADALVDATQILSGIVSTSRLSGFYDIGVGTAINLENAENILSGIVSTSRLAGSYDIDITGTAQTANFLNDAGNINDGIIDAERLTGVYNINITGTASSALSVSPGTYDIDITGISSFSVISGYSTNSGISSFSNIWIFYKLWNFIFFSSIWSIYTFYQFAHRNICTHSCILSNICIWKWNSKFKY
jgi:hypothetical protein